jgi:hypothetical protein
MTVPTDTLGQVGSSSTDLVSNRRRIKSPRAGVDTWRLLFRTTLDRPPEQSLFDVGRYKAQWFPGHSVLAPVLDLKARADQTRAGSPHLRSDTE